MVAGNQIKRAVFEWSSIGATFAAIACLGYWTVSVLSHWADFAVSFGEGTLEVSASAGEITLSDSLEDLSLIDSLCAGGMLWSGPPEHKRVPPLAKHGWEVPGLRYRHIQVSPRNAAWMMRFSLLVPGMLMAIIAVACIRRWRRTLRRLAEASRHRADKAMAQTES